MKVDIYNVAREKIGSLDLPEDVFAVTVREGLLWEEVKAQRASRRRGTHATKTRGMVSGGGIKPFRQKGTGRARQGSSRAPNHVGGGTVFGPHPRDYSYRLPRSARRAALCGALSLRASEQHLVVVDQFPVETPKTKKVIEFLTKFEMPSALIVDVNNENLKKSTRNLPLAKYSAAVGVNVYDILDHDYIVLTKAAIDEVVNKAKGASSSGPDEAAGSVA